MGEKKYQNRNAFAVVVCNAFAVTAACSSESTGRTFLIVCGQKQRLHQVCWSLIFLLNHKPDSVCSVLLWFRFDNSRETY